MTDGVILTGRCKHYVINRKLGTGHWVMQVNVVFLSKMFKKFYPTEMTKNQIHTKIKSRTTLWLIQSMLKNDIRM